MKNHQEPLLKYLLEILVKVLITVGSVMIALIIYHAIYGTSTCQVLSRLDTYTHRLYGSHAMTSQWEITEKLREGGHMTCKGPPFGGGPAGLGLVR